MVDSDVKGHDWNAQLKLGSPSFVGLNYFQSVTPHLSAGGEFFWLQVGDGVGDPAQATLVCEGSIQLPVWIGLFKPPTTAGLSPPHMLFPISSPPPSSSSPLPLLAVEPEERCRSGGAPHRREARGHPAAGDDRHHVHGLRAPRLGEDHARIGLPVALAVARGHRNGVCGGGEDLFFSLVTSCGSVPAAGSARSAGSAGSAGFVFACCAI